MKRCPACNREYDDAVRFCLEDGSTLVRSADSSEPTMTMPAAPEFRSPPPPTLVMPVEPSMSTPLTLANIFIAPARAFASFRDVTTFSPAAIRFLIAAPIIVAAVVAYNVIYLAGVGPARVNRAAMEASPRLASLSREEKERALKLVDNPAYRTINFAMAFGRLILITVVSMPLGALIYWLGAMIFKSPLKYMQALLVWTYASLPATLLWAIVNAVTLLVRPPTNNVAIAMGAGGVLPSNLGALFTADSLPLPVYVVALGAFDLFEFYGLALATLGLRKVARLPWIGSFGIVIFVWLLGVVWRISTAGLASALMR
ncbi:MAG: YIP1 family protein [Acidobacteriota bacterium]